MCRRLRIGPLNRPRLGAGRASKCAAVYRCRANSTWHARAGQANSMAHPCRQRPSAHCPSNCAAHLYSPSSGFSVISKFMILSCGTQDGKWVRHSTEQRMAGCPQAEAGMVVPRPRTLMQQA